MFLSLSKLLSSQVCDLWPRVLKKRTRENKLCRLKNNDNLSRGKSIRKQKNKIKNRNGKGCEDLGDRKFAKAEEKSSNISATTNQVDSGNLHSTQIVHTPDITKFPRLTIEPSTGRNYPSRRQQINNPDQWLK